MANYFTTILIRRDVSANWSVKNPTLASGEFGYELDTVWKDILIAAQTNKSLQTALDRVKIQYHLSKDHAK